VTLLLVAARLAPVTLLVPAFGGARVPWWIRIGLAFLLAGLLAPLVAPAPIAHPELFIPKELAVGVVLALLAAVPFWAAQAAGAASDTAAGLTGRLAELLLLFATVVFFASDGHLLLLRALAASYEAVPIAAPLGNATETVIAATAHLLLAAVGIAAPVLVAVLVTDVALALVARVGRGVGLEAASLLRSYAAAFALLASLATIALAIRGELGLALVKLAHPFG
jgi:type III secretory pathway component EscT